MNQEIQPPAQEVQGGGEALVECQQQLMEKSYEERYGSGWTAGASGQVR